MVKSYRIFSGPRTKIYMSSPIIIDEIKMYIYEPPHEKANNLFRLLGKSNSSSSFRNFKLLAVFCGCTAWFVLDLLKNHIVCFLMRWLISQMLSLYHLYKQVVKIILSIFVTYIVAIVTHLFGRP